jgi:hypothetical protein
MEVTFDEEENPECPDIAGKVKPSARRPPVASLHAKARRPD